MEDNLKYNLFIIDYNNGFEQEVYWFRVDKATFKLNWTRICNKMPVLSQIYRLNCFDVQNYMQENNIRFNMYARTLTREKAISYINANDFNKSNSKLVEHSNIGNY